MAPPPKARIYLASQSPRRQALLREWGVEFELLLADAHEDAEALEMQTPDEDPKTYVCRITQLKLQAALVRRQARGLSSRLILCADTTVALGNEILGKPRDAQHAAEMLRALQGRTHDVFTAVSLGDGTFEDLELSHSRVTFAELNDAEIARYVASGEPEGKAGGYAIQGQAGLWTTHLSGSYTGIMGLPAHETSRLFARAGSPLF